MVTYRDDVNSGHKHFKNRLRRYITLYLRETLALSFPAWLRTRSSAFAHDLIMIPIAWLGAWWLVSDLGPIPQEFLTSALAMLPFLIIVQLSVFHYFDLYRGVWRFASLPDLVRILKAVGVGILLTLVLLFFADQLQQTPHALLPLYSLLLITGLGGSRLFYRWRKDHGPLKGRPKRVLIVGAEQEGEMLARELLRDRRRNYLPVAFVDNSNKRKASEIHGIRVVGRHEDIPRIAKRWAVDLVLIAQPSATAMELRRIVEICESADVEFRTLPKILDLRETDAISDALRKVSIEDLLDRDPVSMDWRSIEKHFIDKTILVTGGGGSIGTELCRQIARIQPRSLIIFERCEFALYQIEQELLTDFPQLTIHPVLGDVLDEGAVEYVLKTYRPELVFHAAAHKHVPILERQAREAVRNNVLGTRILTAAVQRHNVDAFVLISTDKAVNPANILGASKRAAELVCQACGRHSRTRFITVRFGNVLGSAGSVVPLFQEQIRKGGPVTVTHPQVTRYFMTIPEASQLILQSTIIGKGGEIFFLDMGKPVKIYDLAKQMIRLAGMVPDQDIRIAFSGLRPGEKLQEELFHHQESLLATTHSKILLAQHNKTEQKNITPLLDALQTACDDYNEESLIKLLHQLVPSFSTSSHNQMKPPIEDASQWPQNVIPLEASIRSQKSA